jgi:tetratricopeptide (TPR) repeat protein
MVKTHNPRAKIEQTLGLVLSIGLISISAEAGPKPPKQTTIPVAPVEDTYVTVGGWEQTANDIQNKAATYEEIRKADDNPSTTAAQHEANVSQQNSIVEQLDRGAARFPNNPVVQKVAAGAALREDQPDKALTYANRWAGLVKPDSPEWATAMKTGGEAAKRMGDFPTANAYAKKVLEKFPNDKNALSLFFDTKGRAKAGAAPPAATQTAMTAQAPAQAMQPARVSPYNTPEYKALAERLAKVNVLNAQAAAKPRIGDNNEALRLAQEASATEPTGKSFILEARAWVVLDKLADALDRMGKAIELLKKNGTPEELAAAHVERAVIRNKAKDSNGAIEDANTALSIDGRNGLALRERGLAYEAQGNLDAAEADLRKAAEYSPSLMGDLDDFYKRKAHPNEEEPETKRAAAGGAGAWLTNLGLALPLAGLAVVLGAAAWLFMKRDSVVGARELGRYAPTPSLTPPTGKTIGGGVYTLQKQIGEGGMGVVYEASDAKLGRLVAVKCLQPELRARPRECRRFVDEAKIVAQLHHPHIVQIFTILEEEPSTYIVYEHLKGQTLHELLNRTQGRKLPPAAALDFLRQIGDAVDHAHSRNVIHRDLKPANVMLAQVDGKPWVKVMDFGIARQMADILRETKTNTVVGTPLYAAPEQGRGDVTKQSDIFSMGVVLYEMLTGEMPFSGNAPFIKEERRAGRFIAASALTPGLPAAIDLVIEKALDADPRERYHSCAELYQAAVAAFGSLTPPVA